MRQEMLGILIPAVVGTIDISRAFATIPHSLILEGLHALNVDSCTITLVAAFLDTAALEICTNTRETFQLPLRWGIVEGPPLSVVSLAAGTHRLLLILKQDRDFNSAILALPTAMFSSDCPLYPQVWVDDWIIFARSRDDLQTLIRRIAALLRARGMAIKPE